MKRQRLDQSMVSLNLASSRSQAENLIKLGYVEINGEVVTKPSTYASESAKITLAAGKKYVSRAALKLASVAAVLNISFEDKVVLDVGSSTGGFTDFALQNGAKKVIAVDVGTEQLHPSLRTNPKIELHEQTDIRDIAKLTSSPDVVVIDVSFISIRKILAHIIKLVPPSAAIVAMVKPQFEAQIIQKNKGVIKNESMRREILKDFEAWVQKLCTVQNKSDSKVEGQKGNRERFYLLKPL